MRTKRELLLCVTLATSLAGASAAAADETQPIPVEQASAELRADMHRYLREEKRGGAVLMGMGAPAVALGGGLLAQDQPLWRGFAYPVLIMGALEFFGGLLFYARTNRQRAQLDRSLTAQPAATGRAELARMRRINLQFSLIEALELTLIAGGTAMAAVGGVTRNDTLTGVGLGLAAESLGLLTFDLFATRRAHRYTGSVERFQLSASPGLAPAGAGAKGGAAVSLRGAF